MLLHGRLLLDPDEPPEPGWIRLDGARIADIQPGDPPERPDLGDAETLISPGFIDAHLHLPQVHAAGCDGLDLLQWLDDVIYPAEQRWADQTVARNDVRLAFNRLLTAGTLGFAGYGTTHPWSVMCAVDVARSLPLRCHVGQVLMDRSAPPPLLNQPLDTDIIHDAVSVSRSINPRFAVACSDDMLQRSAQLAGDDLFIQTHLAESRRECDTVLAQFPDDEHYTSIYDRHGLLTPRTLLAHGVHLSDHEWALIAQRDAVVVHCPTANTFLQAGVFNLDAAREHGVRVALGSDVAAGPDISMPRVARAMIETAKMRAMVHDGSRRHGQPFIPSPADAWRQITADNAAALGWDDQGRLEVGCRADLLLIKADVSMDEHLLGRVLYTWKDTYITHRILNGALRNCS